MLRKVAFGFGVAVWCLCGLYMFFIIPYLTYVGIMVSTQCKIP